jgi:hypothetical protein
MSSDPRAGSSVRVRRATLSRPSPLHEHLDASSSTTIVAPTAPENIIIRKRRATITERLFSNEPNSAYSPIVAEVIEGQEQGTSGSAGERQRSDSSTSRRSSVVARLKGRKGSLAGVGVDTKSVGEAGGEFDHHDDEVDVVSLVLSSAPSSPFPYLRRGIER